MYEDAHLEMAYEDRFTDPHEYDDALYWEHETWEGEDYPEDGDDGANDNWALPAP